MGKLLGPLTRQGEHPEAKKARAKPRKSQTTKGEGSVVGRYNQMSELAGDAVAPRPLSPKVVDRERIKNHARDAKVRATQDWIDGRLSTKKHANIHNRANHVLAGGPMQTYVGKTGERAPKGKLPW